MKNFKKVIGIILISTVFIGIFAFMVHDSSLVVALKTFGATVLIVSVLISGLFLAVD